MQEESEDLPAQEAEAEELREAEEQEAEAEEEMAVHAYTTLTV
jgi:hypothetical protein